MTKAQMEEIQAEIHALAKKLRDQKGDDYAELHGDDTLWNFKVIGEVGDLLGLAAIRPEGKAWFTYFMKHFIALLAEMKGKTLQSEGLFERAADMHNYIDLGVGLILDAKTIPSEETAGTTHTYSDNPLVVIKAAPHSRLVKGQPYVYAAMEDKWYTEEEYKERIR